MSAYPSMRHASPELEALIEALPMPAMLNAPNGDLLYANAAMRAADERAPLERIPLTLPGLGQCTLGIGMPPARTDAQTQRLAALGFMVAGVCHEVSNPLAAVYSMLQILQSKRGVNRETMEKGLASISANLARVLAITKKLGDFSRVGAETPVAVIVDAAVGEALALLRHTDWGDAVMVEYRGAPGAAVLARPSNVQQVLFNILLNAAQAMEGSGTIEITSRQEDRTVTVSIRDAGPGIPEGDLGRVFDPFFTTKQPGGGTGLGLAISYEIVHELGGTIRASNHPQGGACFEVSLPLWRG